MTNASHLDLRLRPATKDDSRQLFVWANDPVVRQSAFHSEPIVWKDHQRWFASRLESATTLIYLAENPAQQLVGQIRFDQSAANEMEVDVTVAPEFRGLGYGAALIAAGAKAVAAVRPGTRLTALIKPHNVASQHAFQGAGFRSAGEVEVKGLACQKMTFDTRHSGAEPS